MTKRSLTYFSLAMVISCLWGCASKSAYVDPAGPNTAVNVGQINVQDFAVAAVQDILGRVGSGQLTSSEAGKPAIMAISRITNKTLNHIDIDQLVKKIRVELNRSGKILTTTTVAYGGAEDPLAKEVQETLALSGQGVVNRLPDYTLSGAILAQEARKSRLTTQASYIFQLSLTDRSGIAVWESEYIVTKQGRKSAVTW
jgi:hypothetical protein